MSYNLEFTNLEAESCDISLLRKDLIEDYVKFQLIPYQKEQDKIIIAVTEINDNTCEWSKKHFDNYEFITTSAQNVREIIEYHFKEENTDIAVNNLLRLTPILSAKSVISNKQILFLSLILTFTLLMSIFKPHESIFAIFLLLNVFYFTAITVKNLLFFIGLSHSKKTIRKVNKLNNTNLPIYTILIPLFKEERVITKLTNAIKDLDYPKSKLDVKLIVEEDDFITISAIEKRNLESYFHLVKVPFSNPQTKPKACNYALNFARGEYATIYDAEDIPDKMQLKKVLQAFGNSEENVKCVQCKLNFFNWNENLLTKLFSLEYAIHFEYFLLGLEKLNIPIPLGGTSNHFKTDILKELHAWDPYNVTEDADLGIRIYQKNYKCKIIDSTTEEECTKRVKSWINQRSRWIKGHLQTYLVHMREPYKLYKKTGLIGFFGVSFFLAAPCIIFMISPIFFLLFIFLFFNIIDLPNNMPAGFDQTINIAIFMFFYGKISQIIQSIITLKNARYSTNKANQANCDSLVSKKPSNKIVTIIFFTFYWILHSVSSYKSLWQLITKPHFWEKTSHGETTIDSKEV